MNPINGERFERSVSQFRSAVENNGSASGQLCKNAFSVAEARVRAGDTVAYAAAGSTAKGRILPYPKDASELRRVIYILVQWDGIKEPQWELKSALMLSY